MTRHFVKRGQPEVQVLCGGKDKTEEVMLPAIVWRAGHVAKLLALEDFIAGVCLVNSFHRCPRKDVRGRRGVPQWTATILGN